MRKRKMGTHGSFGILLEQEKDLIYVTANSDGFPESMGESLLSVLRTKGVEGLLCVMQDVATRYEYMGLSIASNESFQEWAFSEWTYLYRQRMNSLLVCYPARKGEEKGNLGITGQTGYSKYTYALSMVLEVPVCGTEGVMEVWERTRSLKHEGRYLTLYK